jgi:hypothetical protein
MNGTNNWINFYYKLENNKIDQIQIKESLLSLFNKKFNKLNENQIILIMFKLKQNPIKFRSISLTQKVKVKDFVLLPEFFNECWLSKSKEDYQDQEWNYIIFSYKILELNSYITETKLLKNYETNISLRNSYKFEGYSLPNNVNYKSWGSIIFESDIITLITEYNSSIIYFIKVTPYCLEVDVRLKSYSMKKLFSFTDIFNDMNDLSSFKRIIFDKTYLFEKGQFKGFSENK